MKNLLYCLPALLLLTSCIERGTIQVQNKLPNVKIESISFDEYSMSASLLPGETSDQLIIKDEEKKWPKRSRLEFYMVSGSKTVYLQTRDIYELNYDQDLIVVIEDTTQVLNPR
ncbi:MAG: hypothetical protein ACPF9D_00400 [Owenweeksia sp.]